MGGCDAFIEAAGAASFTDATSMVGAIMMGQSVLLLMGWKKYKESGYSIWPVTPPIWDEVLTVAPRNPALAKTHDASVQLDGLGNPICSSLCYENLWITEPDSPRVLAIEEGETGVPKPGSRRRSLGG